MRYDCGKANGFMQGSLKRLILVCLFAVAEGCGRVGRDPLQDIADRAMLQAQPAVVQIRAVVKNYGGGREVKSISVGSGFIITPKGDIVTNHHVAGRASRLVCVLSDNEEIAAELIGTDPLADIAVLRLAPRPGKPYPTVRFGDSDTVAVGETVLAMGSPLAMSQTTTRGVISNTKMIMPGSFRGGTQFTLDGERVGALVRWFTHDAVIFPGNSGGPLLNLRGEVIGVNEISFGLGGAIPANLARHVSDQLVLNGRVRRAWLGMEIQELLKSSGQERGALVSDVAADSPAAKAGLVSGDILLRLGGHDVTIRYDEEIPLFNQMVAALPIDQPLDAVIRRGDAEQTLVMRPSEREPMLPQTTELKEWGITARDINVLLAQELRVKEPQGALITSVGSAGPAGAAKPVLMPLDLIRRVNDQAVLSVAHLQELTRQIAGATNVPVSAMVEVERQGQSLLSAIRLGVPHPEPPGAKSRKAWMGMHVQAVSREMATLLRTNTLTGVRITQVFPDSQAAAAGLRVGDVIVGLDDERVTVSMVGEESYFFSRIRQYTVGKEVRLGILRAGQATNLVVTLDETPATAQEKEKFLDAKFEFVARDLTLDDRVRQKLPRDLEAVIVVEVTDGGWAALGGLAPGDLILTVAQHPITAVSVLSATMGDISAAKPAQVVMHIRRGIHTMFVELEPEWAEGRTVVASNEKKKEGETR